MKKNVGSADKAVRIIAAIVIAVLYFTNEISGVIAIILGIFAVVFIITSFMSFCPAYLPLGLSTAKKDESK